jgi:hypothetical protein
MTTSLYGPSGHVLNASLLDTQLCFRICYHRYFYLGSGCGRYTCGVARQGIIVFLHTYAEEGVFLSESYLALMAFKNNPSVIGFTVEQMIISKIASSGLR